MGANYDSSREQGEQFQNIAMPMLYNCGIIALCYSGRQMQLRGESVHGIEIKNDTKYGETGNIYIEVSEKSLSSNERYVRSGIYRNDNTWMLAIGDERRLFLFSKKQLQEAHRQKNDPADLFYKYPRAETPTSRGFLLPVAEAERFWAMKIIEGEK